ncbi:MAG: hypothetical protein M1828_003106 [Chrysothrix sp. TS-e1954]|nr:MAG: hypothetical protein M1828_003106 [Chrysothrix sp. TS-e1954]
MSSGSSRTLRRTGKLSVDRDNGTQNGFESARQITGEGAHASATDSRRMLHLMQRCRGHMHGDIYHRRSLARPWTLSPCFVDTEEGSLVHDNAGDDGLPRTLIPDLRGCVVQAHYDSESQSPVLHVNAHGKAPYLQLRPKISTYFNAWFAALLCWQPVQPGQRLQSRVRQQQPSPLAWPIEEHQSTFKTSIDADAPVIKACSARFVQAEDEETVSVTVTSDRAARSSQSYLVRSRKWIEVSCSLRANGLLRICRCSENHTHVATILLTQLPRSAVQRMHSSVLDANGVVAIYPQHARSSNASSRLRPLFISYDSRVSYEVWYALLRAFSIPELYGSERAHPHVPRRSPEVLPGIDPELPPALLRIEQYMQFRVNEARIRLPKAEVQTRNQSSTSVNDDRQLLDPANYYAEILVDDQLKAKTSVKFDAVDPVWYQTFELLDLKSMVTSICIRVKRVSLQLRSSSLFDAPMPQKGNARQSSQSNEQAFGGLGDEVIGEATIDASELEVGNTIERWWPLTNRTGINVGELSFRMLYEQQSILVDRDYDSIWQLLQNLPNTLNQHIAEAIPSELTRLSEILLNIFQVESRSGQWLMSLAEEEIDSVREPALEGHRYARRINSNESRESLRDMPGRKREGLLRHLGRSAVAEANLLFRGNTLLSKTLDLHMKRIGKEYLDETIGSYLRDITSKDIECEVDPVRISSTNELQKNWSRLIDLTENLWSRIAQSSSKCPTELRLILRHIRACADERYGDFMHTVLYSSVSCFLFLRFFCAAVLNPQLFGILHSPPHARAHRTYVLVAKSLQGLANMSTFGAKEPWMEPMNAFLSARRQEFKDFIDGVCSVESHSAGVANMSADEEAPSNSTSTSSINRDTTIALSSTKVTQNTRIVPQYHDILAASPSYSAPMMIFDKLPLLSREGFPSLPHLIDRARNFSALVALWLEATANNEGNQTDHNHATTDSSTTDFPSLAPPRISEFSPTLGRFHEACRVLSHRTADVRERCDVVERRNSAIACKWVGIAERMEAAPGEFWRRSRGGAGGRGVTTQR